MLYFNTLLKLCHFLEYFSLFSCENQMKTFYMIETVNVRMSQYEIFSPKTAWMLDNWKKLKSDKKWSRGGLKGGLFVRRGESYS